MANIGLKQLGDRIDKQIKEINQDQKQVQAIRRTLGKLNATEKELEEKLKDARKSRDRQRERLQEVRKDLDEINEDGITEAEAPDFVALNEKREILADKIDETISHIQKLLEKLDDLGDKEKGVRDRLEKNQKEREQDQKELQQMRKRRDKIRKERKEKEEQQEANRKPSPNFTYAEFACNNGTPAPESSKPGIDALCQQVLEPQRARFGSVAINSGYRPPAYNAAIGGASNSVHLYRGGAVAADHRCAKGGASEWFSNTAGRADGRGRYSTFHHADNRNRMGWPDSVWYG